MKPTALAALRTGLALGGGVGRSRAGAPETREAAASSRPVAQKTNKTSGQSGRDWARGTRAGGSRGGAPASRGANRRCVYLPGVPARSLGQRPVPRRPMPPLDPGREIAGRARHTALDPSRPCPPSYAQVGVRSSPTRGIWQTGAPTT